MARAAVRPPGDARARRHRGEGGAVVPFVAIVLALLVGIASLAVDLGQMRVGRRDMQALADVVALDLSRQVDGRTAAEILADPVWDTERTQSLARNATTYGEAPAVTADLGVVDPTTGAFTPASGATVPDAVRVRSTARVDLAFSGNRERVGRDAVAIGHSPPSILTRTRALGCFALGSYAAAVRLGQGGLLSSLLGGVSPSLDLGALGYQGLLDADITLGRLATQLGVASAGSLATTSVTYRRLLLASADLLAADGNTADAAVLRSIAAGFSSAGSVSLGSLLSVSQAAATGVDATVNVIELVTASALLLRGGNALSIPTLTAGLGLAGVSGSARLIEGPQTACSEPNPVPVGSGEARTAQTSSTVTGTLSPIALPGFVGLSVGSPTSRPVTTSVEMASARGHLTGVTCPSGTTRASSITVATTSGLLSATTKVPVSITGRISVAGVLGLVDVTITSDLSVSASSSANQTASTSITIPPRAFDTPYPTGSGPLRLNAGTPGSVSRTNTVVTAKVAGVNVALTATLVNDILTAATSAVVVPLVDRLNAQLIFPLTQLTGVQVAGADVLALRNPVPPTCYISYLVGPAAPGPAPTVPRPSP